MTAKEMFTHVKKRDGRIVPFDRNRIASAIYKAAYAQGGHDRSLATMLADKTIKLLHTMIVENRIPNIEEIQDCVEKTLIEEGHARTAKAFILYREEQRKTRQIPLKINHTADYIPYEKLWQILNWNVDHKCATIEDLNKRIKNNSFENLITEADVAYDIEVTKAVEEILCRKKDIKLVIIAGPSSSGKTTTTIKISEQLSRNNLHFAALNLDNYFFDLEIHPKDEYGDYDFETPAAMDIDLINAHLTNLLMGKEIHTPLFDFKTGKRIKDSLPFRIDTNEIILIDSLHGLFEPLTQSVPEERKCKIYIETLAQLKRSDGSFIRWTDVRLLRRMIRDMYNRNHSPQKTIEHWHYVRRSEMKFIIPFIHSVDTIINGALPYEIPILKSLLATFFNKFVIKYHEKPDRLDAWKRAHRIQTMFNEIISYPDHSAISKTSLLREFVGGSAYTY